MFTSTVNYTTKGIRGDFVLQDLHREDVLLVDSSGVPYAKSYDIVPMVYRSGNDLVLQFIKIKNERVMSSITVENAYTDNGLGTLVMKNTSSEKYYALHPDISQEYLLWAGTTGIDEIYGASTKNKIFGSTGSDRLTGNDWNDDFYMGPGDDTATGGNGDDDYYFLLPSEIKSGATGYTKTITDFSSEDGNYDTLHLEGVIFGLKLTPTDTYTSETWRKGHVIFEEDGSDGYVKFNLDKDRDAEAVIRLIGATEINDDQITYWGN